MIALPTWSARPSSGLGLGMVFALGQPPYHLWPVALIALAAVFWLIPRMETPKRSAWLGWAFGLGYFGLSMSWIVEPFFVDAAATGWMAPFALIGMAGGLSLFWALAFWGGARLGGGLWFVVTWTLVELARAYVLTGFPWGLVGYVWADSPALQWAAWLGPHGLTLLALAVAFLLAQPGARALSGAAVLAVALFGGAALTPRPTSPEGRPVVRLLQPNAPQHLKWHPEHIPGFFQRQLDYTRAAPAPDLIVWPETALPMLLHEAGEASAIIADAASGAAVAAGIQRWDETGFYNSMILLDDQGLVSALYDKHHLVPFGEYMPLEALFARFNILGLASRAEGGYTSGPGPQLLTVPGVGTVLPLICYEAVFPQDVRGASKRPDLLLHLTNDAWFGTRSGPYQHLQQARIRAVESGLPVLRSANTGVSAVIDPSGRVLDQIPLGTEGFLDAEVPEAKPATLYWRLGDWPVLLLLMMLSFGRMGALKRKRH